MSTNQRECYRCRSLDEGSKALLVLGRKKITVDLIDQSAGGFSVKLRGKKRIRGGTHVKLRTSTGWSEAVVVHAEIVQKETRLGLQRLRELADPRLEAQLNSNSLPFAAPRARGPSATSLTLVVVASFVFWLSFTKPIWLSSLAGWLRDQAVAQLEQLPIAAAGDEGKSDAGKSVE